MATKSPINGSLGASAPSSAGPGRCPRREPHVAASATSAGRGWVSLAEIHGEPFRIFFPAAMLAGLIGVSLWPLMLLGGTDNYPGPSHARLMVQGFFGGFIFGFLGTSMPRLLEARPFSALEVFPLLALFFSNLIANALRLNTLADGLFVAELVSWALLLGARVRVGKDFPPPSFVLVALAFVAALFGTSIQLAGRTIELSEELELFSRLLNFHAFVLLCVLGAGGFLLPRFLGLGLRRKFPESAIASPAWKRSVAVAAGTGMAILGSIGGEALGWSRSAGTVRALVILGYLFYEMPLERLRWHWRGVHWQLIIGLICIPLGVFASGWFPLMRLTWAHLELVAGFALITTGVASRVIAGHSGSRDRVERFNLWVTIAAALMLLGLASRMTGDFFPRIQMNHYLYGAGCWLVGALVWSVYFLPSVLRPDPEG